MTARLGADGFLRYWVPPPCILFVYPRSERVYVRTRDDATDMWTTVVGVWPIEQVEFTPLEWEDFNFRLDDGDANQYIQINRIISIPPVQSLERSLMYRFDGTIDDVVWDFERAYLSTMESGRALQVRGSVQIRLGMDDANDSDRFAVTRINEITPFVLCRLDLQLRLDDLFNNLLEISEQAAARSGDILEPVVSLNVYVIPVERRYAAPARNRGGARPF